MAIDRFESAERESPLVIHLGIAVSKGERMDWIVQKATELGVTRILPIVAHRSDSHLAAAAAKRRERWQRIALQASEQSRRAAPPEIAVPIKLKDLCSAGALPAFGREPVPAANSVGKIVLAESENGTCLRDVLNSNSSNVTLAIGPEGGWTTDELAWFRDAGWEAASLGDNILRAETAAIVATALALDLLR